MEYRRLGSTGLQVSTISIGAWLTYGSSRMEFDNSADCLRRAVEVGINYIDVADAYARGKAEEVVGQVIKDYNRTDLVISTKAYWPMSDNVNDKGLSRKHLMESVHKSLKRFDTDYVDLFFCHRFDADTPVEETVRALDDLVHQGKILYWGTSMWEAGQIRTAVQIANNFNLYRPVTEQPLYNMLDRAGVEGELQSTCAELGIGLVVWSPLAQGVLTGKYNNGVPDDSRATSLDWFSSQISEDRLEKARGITALAQELDVTPAALALAWAMKNPVVSSVITGATKPHQVDENLKALDIKITDEINERIEAVLQNKPETQVAG